MDGYSVREASNAEEGLAALEEEPPDLILLDVMMPGMSGYEMLQAVQDRHGVGTIPVIMFSGQVGGLQSGRRARRAGISREAGRSANADRVDQAAHSASGRRQQSPARPQHLSLGRRAPGGLARSRLRRPFGGGLRGARLDRVGSFRGLPREAERPLRTVFTAACVWSADLIALGLKAATDRARPFETIPQADPLLGGDGRPVDALRPRRHELRGGRRPQLLPAPLGAVCVSAGRRDRRSRVSTWGCTTPLTSWPGRPSARRSASPASGCSDFFGGLQRGRRRSEGAPRAG